MGNPDKKIFVQYCRGCGRKDIGMLENPRIKKKVLRENNDKKGRKQHGIVLFTFSCSVLFSSLMLSPCLMLPHLHCTALSFPVYVFWYQICLTTSPPWRGRGAGALYGITAALLRKMNQSDSFLYSSCHGVLPGTRDLSYKMIYIAQQTMVLINMLEKKNWGK